MITKKLVLSDDSREKILPLISHRIPWLLVGLIGGIFAIALSARFEELLATNIQVAFFIPVIVYMADAIGTQTETIYVRSLASNKTSLGQYLFKELLLGICVGLFFGLILGIFAFFYFGLAKIAMAVFLAMFATGTCAPLIALIVPTILLGQHTDPALGGGPFTTIIQDLLSLVIYFMIASAILL